MIVIEKTTSQSVVFAIVLCEFEGEGAVGRALAVSFSTLICRLSFLASIAVEYVDAVAVWVVTFCSL